MRDKATVYVGRRGRAQGPEDAADLPLPIYPPDMIRVLGIGPLDAQAGSPAPPVEWDNGFVIQPPHSAMKLVIDPATYLANRIDLLDSAGQPRLVARLTRPQTVALSGRPPGDWPKMATILELSIPGSEDRMTLYLSDLQDGQGRIWDAAFDLAHLIKVNNPRVFKNVGSGGAEGGAAGR